jgi:ABC-type phosphate/phosphonate transport system ATPase subunit
MTNVDFAYPGKDKLTLRGVSCSLCLGSRVVVLGANGAGKVRIYRSVYVYICWRVFAHYCGMYRSARLMYHENAPF